MVRPPGRIPEGGAGGVLLGTQPVARALTSILVAVDGSVASDAAVEAALELAAREGASIVFVHVASGVAPDRDALARATARAAAAGIASSAEPASGEPAAAILDTAAAHDAGLVVLGSRGRGPVAGAVLGTVSKAVLDAIDRPLLIVRRP